MPPALQKTVCNAWRIHTRLQSGMATASTHTNREKESAGFALRTVTTECEETADKSFDCISVNWSWVETGCQTILAHRRVIISEVENLAFPRYLSHVSDERLHPCFQDSVSKSIVSDG